MYTDGDIARTGQKGAHVLGRHLTGRCDILPENFFTFRLLAYLKFLFINTLRTGDADLRFYITTVQDG
jgi:hypothetical protein